MNKQKVVIGLSIHGKDKRSRSKAFKIAVSQPGVNSAAIKEGENNQLEVEGNQIDAAVLIKRLRKKLKKGAELLSVGPVDKKDGNKKEDPKIELVPMMQWPSYNYPYHVVPQYPFYEVTESYPGGCSIL
ncbi:heavy metal-associated isoprenylated plant protein 12-like [Solanum dulcamara]|uniref:heavy metal-associated isoprenylated plant protein 12-like n=1 Tax=Solanum dulcamara TaxID=45834 RepID=UPI002484EC55|nr:heavy metal-associated isoprenylated plant protein 12-like [Solanum dulcamara]